MKRWTKTLVLAIACALVVGACSSPSAPEKAQAQGTLSGFILIVGGAQGVTKDDASDVVEVKDGNRLLATQRVSPGSKFHFSLSPGQYQLDVVGIANCSGSPMILSQRTTEVNVSCTPAPGIG